jgi:hypothetical protein
MRGILVEEVAAKQTISCSPLTLETKNYDRKGQLGSEREFEEVIMVEVLIEEMSVSDRCRPLDYERATVVDAQSKEKTSKTACGSERRSALKDDLTGPTLLELIGTWPTDFVVNCPTSLAI